MIPREPTRAKLRIYNKPIHSDFDVVSIHKRDMVSRWKSCKNQAKLFLNFDQNGQITYILII